MNPILSYALGVITPIVTGRLLSISNRDKRLYKEFVELFPENTGFIHAVNEIAPGDYYDLSDLRALEEFCVSWEKDSKTFEDISIQTTINAFMTNAQEFRNCLYEHGDGRNSRQQVKIDADHYTGESPDEYYKRRDKLFTETYNLTQKIIDNYDDVLYACRKLEGRSLPFPLGS